MGAIMWCLSGVFNLIMITSSTQSASDRMFFFLRLNTSPLKICITFSKHSSLEGHRWLLLLAVANTVAIIWVCRCLRWSDGFFGYVTRSTVAVLFNYGRLYAVFHNRCANLRSIFLHPCQVMKIHGVWSAFLWRLIVQDLLLCSFLLRLPF